MKKALSFIIAIFIAGAVYAQSADVITSMLETEEVNYGQLCYLSAVHQNLIEDNASFEDAVKVLYEKGQLPSEVNPYDTVYMVNLSYIYMQMWPEAKGGLMYRLTKGSPRYAFKQLRADGCLPLRADPKAVVSGVTALDILSACMVAYGGSAECMDLEIEE